MDTYVVTIADEEIEVEITQIDYTEVIAEGNIPVQVTLMGGIPGPKGDPGEDALSDTALLALHILDPTPHPPYDDAPSFTLIFENGLV